jgi:UDP-N-acetylglucosamine 2-epimerase (non-hydrolysing)
MREKILHCVGARPNFMKIAPVIREMSKFNSRFDQVLLHTGQHYDKDMSKSFFADLNLPNPDIYLGVGSGTHAEQTGTIMIEFEKCLLQEKPDLVVVVGDVNSTLACSLVAAKMGIRVAHVEAGLRSFDWTMPEEINRVLTDKLSDFLFTTCEDAGRNLAAEGIPDERIHFAGNVMIDSLLGHLRLGEKSEILDKLHLREKAKIQKYALITLHRPSNVDRKETLAPILDALEQLNGEIPVIFPAHPRTLKQITKFNLDTIPLLPPVRYIDFISLMSNAAIVLTDSGGIQEETTILGVPCLTLRPNTERPITITEGTNTLVGNDPQKIMSEARRILEDGIPRKKMPRFWDGKAAGRIVEVLLGEERPRVSS